MEQASPCPITDYTSDAAREGDNIIGTVGSNVEYAFWADQKQPHLTAAVDQNQEAVKRKIEAALKQRYNWLILPE